MPAIALTTPFVTRDRRRCHAKLGARFAGAPMTAGVAARSTRSGLPRLDETPGRWNRSIVGRANSPRASRKDHPYVRPQTRHGRQEETAVVAQGKEGTQAAEEARGRRTAADQASVAIATGAVIGWHALACSIRHVYRPAPA